MANQTTSDSTLFSIIETANPFRNHWYAVAPIGDLPVDRPYGIELFNTPLVVFLDRKHDVWRCMLDRCRHRCTSLSCGSVSPDGTIACLYHGWTYDGEGYCVHIPSLPNFHRS